MLALDALQGFAPTLWAVFTTRTATLDMARFYAARRQVLLALRRRWPHCQLAWVLEFTTGYGPRSGGRRRPHWNALIKGIPTEDLDLARDVALRVWCSRVDALPQGQYVGEIAHVGGLMRYLALHFLKQSQAPPEGFRGHRFSTTRGYFAASAASERDRARAALRLKRELWSLINHEDCPDELVDVVAADRIALAAATTWELVSLTASAARTESAAGAP